MRITTMSLSMYRRKPGPLETVSLLLLPFAFYAVKGSAFVVQQTAPSNTRLAAVELVFDGDCNIVSDPLPSDVTKNELLKYFCKRETRNCFFSAGGTRGVEELKMTPEFRKMWSDECDKLSDESFMQPSDGDDDNSASLIGVEAKINFPGLELTSTTVSVVKTLSKDDFPEYHVLGIAEQQRVDGPPPVVWLYSQLTGLNKKKKGKFYPPSASARSTISIVDTEDKYAFSFDVKLEVVTKVPRVLVTILPTSTEKMEEQGSAAVSKTVVKDMESSIKYAVDQFLKGKVAA